jgi:hypothetical protein
MDKVVRDKAKWVAIMTDPVGQENARRCDRDWQQRKRDATKADPEASAAARRTDKERKLERACRLTPEQHEAERAHRQKKYKDAIANTTPEKMREMQEARHARYLKQKGSGTRQWDKIVADPGAHEKAKERMRVRAHKYQTSPCEVCTEPHYSRIYDTCRECRGHEKKVKAFETEVIDFFEYNNMYPSLADRKGPCASASTSARADLVFSARGASNTVILEVDEGQHMHLTPECEIARMADIRDQYTGTPIVCIRYSPEAGGVLLGQGLRIRPESKEAALLAVRGALVDPTGNSALGYELRFVGYNESRQRELAAVELRMHAEQLQLFHVSSSSSSSSDAAIVEDIIAKSNEALARARLLKGLERRDRSAAKARATRAR